MEHLKMFGALAAASVVVKWWMLRNKMNPALVKGVDFLFWIGGGIIFYDAFMKTGNKIVEVFHIR